MGSLCQREEQTADRALLLTPLSAMSCAHGFIKFDTERFSVEETSDWLYDSKHVDAVYECLCDSMLAEIIDLIHAMLSDSKMRVTSLTNFTFEHQIVHEYKDSYSASFLQRRFESDFVKDILSVDLSDTLPRDDYNTSTFERRLPIESDTEDKTEEEEIDSDAFLRNCRNGTSAGGSVPMYCGSPMLNVHMVDFTQTTTGGNLPYTKLVAVDNGLPVYFELTEDSAWELLSEDSFHSAHVFLLVLRFHKAAYTSKAAAWMHRFWALKREAIANAMQYPCVVFCAAGIRHPVWDVTNPVMIPQMIRFAKSHNLPFIEVNVNESRSVGLSNDDAVLGMFEFIYKYHLCHHRFVILQL